MAGFDEVPVPEEHAPTSTHSPIPSLFANATILQFVPPQESAPSARSDDDLICAVTMGLTEFQTLCKKPASRVMRHSVHCDARHWASHGHTHARPRREAREKTCTLHTYGAAKNARARFETRDLAGCAWQRLRAYFDGESAVRTFCDRAGGAIRRSTQRVIPGKKRLKI